MTHVRKLVVPAVATLVSALALWWATASLDPDGPGFAFVVVWVPMTALGTISHVTPVRLPERAHRLRPIELDGGIYERLGVRWAKRLARRGPISWWNPGMHLPSRRDAASLAGLEAKMREAEASHAVLFVVGVATAAVLGGLGCAVGAAWVLGFDVLVNGYPWMLQRYNRAMLRRVSAGATVGGGDGRAGGPRTGGAVRHRGGRGRGERTFATTPPTTSTDDHPGEIGSAGPVPVAEGCRP